MIFTSSVAEMRACHAPSSLHSQRSDVADLALFKQHGVLQKSSDEDGTFLQYSFCVVVKAEFNRNVSFFGNATP